MREELQADVIVLAISYDLISLNNRIRTLSDAGHFVVPAADKKAALERLRTCRVDAIAIGASVPAADREAFISAGCTKNKKCRILVTSADGTPVPGADLIVPPGNERALLEGLVKLKKRSAADIFFSRRPTDPPR